MYYHDRYLNHLFLWDDEFFPVPRGNAPGSWALQGHRLIFWHAHNTITLIIAFAAHVLSISLNGRVAVAMASSNWLVLWLGMIVEVRFSMNIEMEKGMKELSLQLSLTPPPRSDIFFAHIVCLPPRGLYVVGGQMRC